MSNQIAEKNDKLSLTVLSVFLAATNIAFVVMANHYTDIFQQIF